MSNIAMVYVLGAALALVLVVVYWRRVVRAVLLLAGLGMGGMVAWAFAQQAAATRQVATAATVAATGSAAGNVLAALLSGVLLAVVLAGGGYIWVMRRKTTGTTTDREMDDRTPAALDDPMRAINALISLEMLRMVRDLRGGEQPQWALPQADDRDDDRGNAVVPAWW